MYNNNTRPSTKKKRSGCARFLSCLVVVTLVLIVVGAVYGLANGNIWNGITGIYNRMVDGIAGIINSPEKSTDLPATGSPTPTLQPTEVTTSPPRTVGIDAGTGIYKNYYLGLVKTPGGVINGDCYGDFIVLINNKNARNPTYAELVDFLASDNTDAYAYRTSISALGFYYGDAEDQIDLTLLQDIIDGASHPKAPKICADFAERLHNNAEMAGIRCGYITLNSPNHALNVFETTDKGLVYIDDTGAFLFGPDNCDKVVDLKEGTEYIPVSLFPEPGWENTWDSMGIVSGIYITWAGTWN